MIPPVLTILSVAVLFYVAIPGIGAFGVRQRWRHFRNRVIGASLLPPVTYASLRGGSGGRSGSPRSGADARFLGTLESIQGERTLWIRNPEITVAVDMSQSDVYMVAQRDTDLRDAPPARTSWSRIGSLPEGVKVLVSGKLDTDGPHPIIRSGGGERVLVVFYDGPETGLVRHCVWSGRQLNEYWNSVTPGALAGGTLALIILAYFMLRAPLSTGLARLAIGLASIPVLPLLPPGLAVFYLYRRTWRRGRILRAHRDVLLLPLRYLDDDECAHLPTGELYCRKEYYIDALYSQWAAGLTLIEAPVDAYPHGTDDTMTYCTVFGRPGLEGVGPPSDVLSEWVAVRGDPETVSMICQKRARRFEVASGLILSAGLLINFLLIMILLAFAI